MVKCENHDFEGGSTVKFVRVLFWRYVEKFNVWHHRSTEILRFSQYYHFLRKSPFFKKPQKWLRLHFSSLWLWTLTLCHFGLSEVSVNLTLKSDDMSRHSPASREEDVSKTRFKKTKSITFFFRKLWFALTHDWEVSICDWRSICWLTILRKHRST